MNKRYTYRGPATSCTLVGEGGERELILRPGGQYELPAEHPYIAGLASQGLLEAVAPAEPEPAPEDAGKKTRGKD